MSSTTPITSSSTRKDRLFLSPRTQDINSSIFVGFFKLGDLKVYFTRLALSKGLDIKPQFGLQKYLPSSQPVLFQISAATKDEAKTLAKMAHDCGSLTFELSIVEKPPKVAKNNTSAQIVTADQKQSQTSNQPGSRLKPKADSTFGKVADLKTSLPAKNKESAIYAADGSTNMQPIPYQASFVSEQKNPKREQVSNLKTVSHHSQYAGQESNTFPSQDVLGDQANSKRAPVFPEVSKSPEERMDAHRTKSHNQNDLYEEPNWNPLSSEYWDGRIPVSNYHPAPVLLGQQSSIKPSSTSSQHSWSREAPPKNHYLSMQAQQGEVLGGFPYPETLPHGYPASIPGKGKNGPTYNQQQVFENQNVTLRDSISDASSTNQPQRRKTHINHHDNSVRNTTQHRPANLWETEHDFTSSGLSYVDEPRAVDLDLMSQSQSSIQTPSKHKPASHFVSSEINQSSVIRHWGAPISQALPISDQLNQPFLNFPGKPGVSLGSEAQTPSVLDSVSHDGHAKPIKDKSLLKKSKDKSSKEKNRKAGKDNETKDYSTLLQICYWPIHDLSEAWLQRIYKLAKKLKKIPHSMFGIKNSNPDEVEKDFLDIKELHPLGKFLKKSVQVDDARHDSSDDEQLPAKYDTSQFISLNYGQRDFGGIFVPKKYNIWRGVSSRAEESLIGAVSRGRLAMIDPDSSFEAKTSVLMQTNEDVLAIGRSFRESHLATQAPKMATNRGPIHCNHDTDFQEILEDDDELPGADEKGYSGDTAPSDEKGSNSRSAKTETSQQ